MTSQNSDTVKVHSFVAILFFLVFVHYLIHGVKGLTSGEINVCGNYIYCEYYTGLHAKIWSLFYISFSSIFGSVSIGRVIKIKKKSILWYTPIFFFIVSIALICLQFFI